MTRYRKRTVVYLVLLTVEMIAGAIFFAWLELTPPPSLHLRPVSPIFYAAQTFAIFILYVFICKANIDEVKHMEATAHTYPLLTALHDNALDTRYELERNLLLKKVPKLSPARAGELIAAYLAELMFTEWGKLEYAIHNAHEESAETRLYDALNDASFTAPLVELSGSRTILSDLGKLTQEDGFLLRDALLHLAEREVH